MAAVIGIKDRTTKQDRAKHVKDSTTDTLVGFAVNTNPAIGPGCGGFCHRFRSKLNLGSA